VQRVRDGRHDSRKQSADADCEGESREVSELSLEDGLVTKLGGELGIRLIDLFEVENLLPATRPNDLNESNALLALSRLAQRGRSAIAL
jgi:hypothetical protein